MKVATRLRSAFAVYIALLAAVVIYHARTIQRAGNSGRGLTEIFSRLRASSADQAARLVQMSGDAAKFQVTRDPGYLQKYQESGAEFGRTLQHLDSIPLTEGERVALVPLLRDWRIIEGRTTHLAAVA